MQGDGPLAGRLNAGANTSVSAPHSSWNEQKSAARFVSACNGARDFYQLPGALLEGGMLERHVTDFYMPDVLARLPLSNRSRTVRRLQGRHSELLPSRLVANNLEAMFLQARGLDRRQLTTQGVTDINRALSSQAAEIADRTEAHLFMYSGAGYWAFNKLSDRVRLLFQFHPHPQLNLSLLSEDFSKYPEVSWSFFNEQDTVSLAEQAPETLVEWRHASRILCASQFTKRSLEAAGCPGDRVTVAPYGSWPRAASIESRGGSARCRFLFVGQGVQRKGLHHLLRAWRIAKLPDCELHLVCWKIDPGLVRDAAQPGVTLLGGMTRSELNRAYDAADIFVLPSLVEGFGLVYQEAMSAGLYCIGTHNTGLPDLEPPDDVATIIDAGDVEACAMALIGARERWVQAGLDRARIAEFAYKRTWRNFRDDVRAFANLAVTEATSGTGVNACE